MTDEAFYRMLDFWLRLRAAEYRAFRQGLLPRIR